MNPLFIAIFFWNMIGFALFLIIMIDELSDHIKDIKKWKLVILSIPFGILPFGGTLLYCFIEQYGNKIYNIKLKVFDWLER